MENLRDRQAKLLERIERLERLFSIQPKSCGSFPPAMHADSEVQTRISHALHDQHVTEFCFRRVPADYYGRDLEYRRKCLDAASVDHLCKSIIFENTKAHPSVVDCNNPNNSKYYCVIVQYTARFHSEKLKRHIHKLNDGVGIKWFNMRLAPDEESQALTGYGHNAVTPVGMKHPIPIVLSHKILELDPPFFWMGGGEVDLKLGLSTAQFVAAYSPLLIDCTYNEGE